MTTHGRELFAVSYSDKRGELRYTPWRAHITEVTDMVRLNKGVIHQVLTREGGNMFIGYGDDAANIHAMRNKEMG